MAPHMSFFCSYGLKFQKRLLIAQPLATNSPARQSMAKCMCGFRTRADRSCNNTECCNFRKGARGQHWQKKRMKKDWEKRTFESLARKDWQTLDLTIKDERMSTGSMSEPSEPADGGNLVRSTGSMSEPSAPADGGNLVRL